MLWLVVAYVGHSLSLRQQVRTMGQLQWQTKRAAEHTEVIARALVELQVQTVRGSFYSSLAVALSDLNGHIAALARVLGLVREEDLPGLWTRVGNGDEGALARLFLDAARRRPPASPSTSAPVQWGTRTCADTCSPSPAASTG